MDSSSFPTAYFNHLVSKWSEKELSFVERLAALAALKDFIALLGETPYNLNFELHDATPLKVIQEAIANTSTFIKKQLVPLFVQLSQLRASQHVDDANQKAAQRSNLMDVTNFLT